MGWNSGESSNDLYVFAGFAAFADLVDFAGFAVFADFAAGFDLAAAFFPLLGEIFGFEAAALGAVFFFADFLVERVAATLLAFLEFVRFAFLSTAIFNVLWKCRWLYIPERFRAVKVRVVVF